VSRQLKAPALLIGGLALVIAPIWAYLALTRPDRSPLFRDLGGPRTAGGDLIINEKTGSFAGVQVGMPFAAAQQLLPAKRRCDTEAPPAVGYCDGVGLIVDITPACGLQIITTTRCPKGSEVGPLGEIDIEAVPGYIGPNEGFAVKSISESQQAVTDRGVRLGDSLKTVERNYAITDKTPSSGLRSCPGTGVSYTALAGENTIVFSVEAGAVEVISLFAGREPHVCTNY
jgi:hypothetical protein